MYHLPLASFAHLPASLFQSLSLVLERSGVWDLGFQEERVQDEERAAPLFVPVYELEVLLPLFFPLLTVYGPEGLDCHSEDCHLS